MPVIAKNSTNRINILGSGMSPSIMKAMVVTTAATESMFDNFFLILFDLEI